jgi:hypothetical protein
MASAELTEHRRNHRCVVVQGLAQRDPAEYRIGYLSRVVLGFCRRLVKLSQGGGASADSRPANELCLVLDQVEEVLLTLAEQESDPNTRAVLPTALAERAALCAVHHLQDAIAPTQTLVMSMAS